MADTLEVIKCPACGKTMKKVFIKENGVNIDICADGCGGIFFDNRELEKFDELHENADEIMKLLEGKNFEQVDDSEQRFCPCCHNMPLTKMGAAGGKIKIDVCNKCGGKFLDNGELQRIREYADDFVNDKEFVKQLLRLEKEDLKTVNFFNMLIGKYRQIVPWHND